MAGTTSLLIVDPDDASRQAVSSALMAAGYHVRSAPDGAAAVRELRRESPQLVVVDAGLADLTAALAAVRSTPGGAPPVVLLTHGTRIDDAVLDAVDDWIDGPVPGPMLARRIDRLLRRRPSDGAAIAPSPEASAAVPADEGLARITRLYRMLSRANEVMVRSATEQALYEAVCRIAVDEGQFRMAALVLAGSDGRARPVAHAGHEDGYFAAVLVTTTDEDRGRGTIGTAIRSGTADVCNDMSGDPRMAPWRDEALARGYHATASFPLRLRDRTIGALVLFAAETGYFQSDEVGLLTAVADDLSFAIESLTRERERQQAEARLRRINRLYAVSSEINAAIVRATRSEDLYEQACRIAVEHGGLVMAWVGLARPGEFLRPAAHAGHDAGYLDQLHISTADDHPTGLGPAGRAFRSRRPTAFNDIANDTGAFVSRAEALERGYHSCAAFPLEAEGEAFGVFVVYGDQPGLFNTEELTLLEALAGNLSHAVESIERRRQRERAESALAAATTELREREALLAAAQRIGRMGSWRYDETSGRLEWSDVTCELFGIAPEAFTGSLTDYERMVLPDDLERVRDARRRLASTGHGEVDYRVRRPDGEVRWMHERGTVEYDDAGVPLRRLGMVMDVTERRREERRQAWEASVLESMSAGMPLPAVLDQICLGMEGMIDGALTSILLVEPATGRLRHGAAPSLPADYNAAIDGMTTGEGRCSCGTAAHRREPVIVIDIDRDPLWQDFRHLTRPHGLRACWSLPLTSTAGEVVATFALYFREPRAPHPDELAVLERTGHLVSIAVERERKDQAFRASEERFRRAFQGAATGMSVTTLEGQFLEANDAFCRMVGYTSDELRRIDFLAITHPDDRAENSRLIRDLVEGRRQSFVFEKRYVRADGGIVRARVSVSIVLDGDGRSARVIGVAEDVTAGHRARRQLEEFFDLSVELMAIVGLDGRFRRVNGAFTRVLGYDTREFLERPYLDFIHPDDRAAVAETIEQLAAGQRVDYVELRALAVDGAVRQFAMSAAPMLEEGIFYVVARDITDQMAAVQAVRDSEERFRLLSKATNDAIWDWDLLTDAIWWNEGFTTLFGFSREEIEPTIVSWTNRIHPDDLEPITAAVDQAIARGDESWSGEYRFRRKDGSYAHVLDRGHIIRDPAGQAVRMIGGMTDLTERRQLEQQYLRAQRMESIGTLAGGIAHDLNNVLAPVLMSIGLLQMEEQDPDRREILATIEQSARRGAEMVRQVLSFARGLEGRRVDVQLSRLLRDLLRITGDTFPKNIRVVPDLAPGLWSLKADPTQLHQVLLNLCVNARDAMPDGGRITIRAANLMIDEHYAAMNIDARVGPYLQIEVEDTGVGMSGDIVDKIFDPFFTTKDLGKGTGLGLSTSLAIVKSHGGFIRVYSELGRGTIFRLYLPAVADEGLAAEAAVAEATLPRGRGETILVVDDEAAVRQITKQTLEAFGYRVLLAADGSEAVSTYVQHQATIALVLTDMMMPVMDGPATIRVLRRLNPGIRVIGASGIPAGDGAARAVSTEVEHFLPKPYTADTLLTAVRRLLDAPDGDA